MTIVVPLVFSFVFHACNLSSGQLCQKSGTAREVRDPLLVTGGLLDFRNQPIGKSVLFLLVIFFVCNRQSTQSGSGHLDHFIYGSNLCCIGFPPRAPTSPSINLEEFPYIPYGYRSLPVWSLSDRGDACQIAIHEARCFRQDG